MQAGGPGSVLRLDLLAVCGTSGFPQHFFLKQNFKPFFGKINTPNPTTLTNGVLCCVHDHSKYRISVRSKITKELLVSQFLPLGVFIFLTQWKLAS